MTDSWLILTTLCSAMAAVFAAHLVERGRARSREIIRRMTPPERRRERARAPLWSPQLCNAELLASGEMSLYPADFMLMKMGQNFPITKPSASRRRRAEARKQTLQAQMRTKLPTGKSGRGKLAALSQAANAL